METQAALNYRRIAKAIDYIRLHYRQQPGLEEIADHVGLSPTHFQRVFADWAGTSPKQFLKHVSLQHAKQLLKTGTDAAIEGGIAAPTTAEVAYATGLSGTSRLHDLFVSIEGMTPAEYRDGGRNLLINYQVEQTPFGTVLIASTSKGVCHLAFIDETVPGALATLAKRFPKAVFQYETDVFQEQALSIFRKDWQQLPAIKLHLKGTPFQLKVWECLLKIPRGGISTYGRVAGQIGTPKASRAVGAAIGSNPVAFLIPCHRVIRGDGGLGGYHWGPTRKQVMLAWERTASVEEAVQGSASSSNKRS